MDDIERILNKMRVNLDGYQQNLNDPKLKFFYDQQFYVDCRLFDEAINGLNPAIWGNYLEKYERLVAEKQAPYKIQGNKNKNEIEEAIKYYIEQLNIILEAFQREVFAGENLDVIARQRGRMDYYLDDMKYNNVSAKMVDEYEQKIKQIYKAGIESMINNEKGLSK